MSYRVTTLNVVVADDQNLSQKEVDRSATFYQIKDLGTFNRTIRVAPADLEAQVPLQLSSCNYICVLSDYPIMVRLNGNTATQYTLRSNNVAATNISSPLPDQCCFLMTGAVTSLYVAPISSAAQTATVKIIATGDPSSAYV